MTRKLDVASNDSIFMWIVGCEACKKGWQQSEWIKNSVGLILHEMVQIVIEVSLQYQWQAEPTEALSFAMCQSTWHYILCNDNWLVCSHFTISNHPILL